MKIAIGIAATGKYCYALCAQRERLVSVIQTSPEHEYTVIFVGNNSSKKAYEEYRKEIEPLAKTIWCCEDVDDSKKNYEIDAQLVIARLQGRYFHEARKAGVDYLWSLEADVLPPANAVRVMLDSLRFDDGFYCVSMITYPSQGGGGFLGGFGTPARPIERDFLPSERSLPDDLKARWESSEKENAEFLGKNQRPNKEWIEVRVALEKEVDKCPPRANVWHLQGDQYRRRGWLDQAMPGIGRGSIIPCDWVGLGCTMISRRALAVAHFEGYEGKGTQDLYLCWHRWYPAGMKLCTITHALCDHVIRERKEDGSQSVEKLTLAHAYHETEGECRGHLRTRHVPFLG